MQQQISIISKRGENMKKTIEQLANEERKAYFTAWRSANKDKVKKHNANYWTRKAEKRLLQQGGK